MKVITTSFYPCALKSFLLFCVFCPFYLTAQSWSFAGIPYPDWAYDPFAISLEEPASWPEAPTINYYYVAPDHPNASDNVLDGELTGSFGRFGYPDRPRLTIPTNNWIGDVFSSGTVIWLSGGIYNGSQDIYSIWSPEFHGTGAAPVWLYGDPNNKPVFSNFRLAMYNSQYAIVDNLQWIGGNTINNAITLTRDRQGPTHHITLRNLLFENLNHIAGGGAIVGLSSNVASGAELHDVVAYKNTFKNCGGGYDWGTEDRDHHAYKVNGRIGGNEAYRIWIIENNALVGSLPDPVDGRFKSLSGNLVQVGDQISSSGGNHHVFVAGNYQEFGRQALGWTKKSSDVIFSGNFCTETYALAGGNGQAYGHQYSIGTHNWWINNVATKNSTGWQHTSNDAMTGPLFIVGNLFYDNRVNESNDNWRICSGVSLWNQRGKHYIVNNIFDSSCHGVWAGTNRHSDSDKLHIYNNIFSNISSNVDATSRAMTFDISRGLSLYIGNNLFDTYDSGVRVSGTNFSTLNDLNTQIWAEDNLAGAPQYINDVNNDYDLLANSPAINTGTQDYIDGSADVYQQYIDRYANDPLYPGNPSDYWHKDFLNRNRIVGGQIDIGPFEFSSIALPAELVMFTAELDKGKVLLNWITTNENQLSNFQIERSTDGINFSVLARHNPLDSEGTSQSYSFLDDQIPGTVRRLYYRIAMVDLDQTINYSTLRAVDTGELQTKFWPNPIREKLFFRGMPKASVLEVIDVNGRLIAQHYVRGVEDQEVISTLNWKPGIYLIRVVKQGEIFFSGKALKLP